MNDDLAVVSVEKRVRGGGAGIASLVQAGLLCEGARLRCGKHEATIDDYGRIFSAHLGAAFERPCAFVEATQEGVKRKGRINGYSAVEAWDESAGAWRSLSTLRRRSRVVKDEKHEEDQGAKRKRQRRARRMNNIERDLKRALHTLHVQFRQIKPTPAAPWSQESTLEQVVRNTLNHWPV